MEVVKQEVDPYSGMEGLWNDLGRSSVDSVLTSHLDLGSIPEGGSPCQPVLPQSKGDRQLGGGG